MTITKEVSRNLPTINYLFLAGCVLIPPILTGVSYTLFNKVKEKNQRIKGLEEKLNSERKINSSS